MKKTRFTETQIVSALKRQEGGIPTKELCRELGISEATFYNWKSKYGGMEASEVKRIKELEEENARLKRVIRTLDRVIEINGKPEVIRVDNGPEFTSKDFELWAKEKGIHIQYIQPGRPMQNGYIERFNRLYRESVLDAYLFFDLYQVRELTQDWMEEYNHKRPHESLGNLTPVEYKILAAEKKKTQLIPV